MHRQGGSLSVQGQHWMTRERNIAVVGGGYWGQNLIRNFFELGALRCICDSNAATLARYSELYPDIIRCNSIEQVLADTGIRGVVIATPAATHYRLAKLALEANKDVLVEKPLALRQQEGAELVEVAQRRQRILMVGHVLQYHPAVRKLKELIDAGELGKIQYIYSNRLNIGKIRTEENILWSFAPHDISLMLMLVGALPEFVTAQGASYLQHNVPDVTLTSLVFPHGTRGHIFVSWLHPHKEQRLVVVGERKMAVFNDTDERHKLIVYSHHVDWKEGKPIAQKSEPQPILIPPDEPLRIECLHFLDSMATRSKPSTDGAEGLAVLTVLEACQRSLDHDGQRVAVTSTPQNRRYYVHESAYVDEPCDIGEGTKIWHFSHILKNTKIGTNCVIGQNVVIGPNVTIGHGVKIQNNVSVYQGVTLEDEVFCGPSMVFTNVNNPRSAIPRMHELRPTLVKRGATIGANATIVCGHTIGRYSFVGAGAVVTRDVPDYALVIGNPARIAGWVCRCGARLEFANGQAVCAACTKRYTKTNDLVEPID